MRVLLPLLINDDIKHGVVYTMEIYQSGISPKVVALFSATNFSSYIINRMAWQWAETLVEIRGTLADIRGTTK